MTNFIIRKTAVLAVAAAAAGTSIIGCSADGGQRSAQSSERVGELGITLAISPGTFVNEVAFSITGAGLSIPITGVIPVEDIGSTVSALVGTLPVGVGYEIDLTATSVDGDADCAGSATFDILAGETTQVDIILDCEIDVHDGNLEVGGDFNTCPEISGFLATPLEVWAGTPINLFASATDENDDTLTFTYTSSNAAGTFADASSPNTTYDCIVGTQTLTLTVADERCDDSLSVDILCVSAGVCGNTILELGEVCDDGNVVAGDGCNATCSATEACGDGTVNLAGETCDDGNLVNGDGCSAACTVEGCGNGTVDSGEGCDDGNNTAGDGCNAACQDEECGNDVLDAGEVCDDGNVVNGDGCEDDCTITPDLCVECTDDSCALEQTACNASCQTVHACYVSSNCGLEAVVDCYCGTADASFCGVPGFADGACKSQIEAAAGTNDPTFISDNLLDPGNNAGDASILLECQRSNCAGDCDHVQL